MKDQSGELNTAEWLNREGLRPLNLCLESWWLLWCNDGDRKRDLKCLDSGGGGFGMLPFQGEPRMLRSI